jgi:hypothetical protein
MTRWICLMLAPVKGGEVSMGSGRCTLLPYYCGCGVYGQCCDLAGIACLYFWRELFDDISRQANIQSRVVVIPIQLDATVEVAIPSYGEFILFLEALYQMVDIVLVDVFHAKVVNHQGE